jgi:N-acetylneuraminate synthase
MEFNKIIKKNECFIIAEAGVNHNGSLNIAKKLVDAAKEAGADAIKFQTFKAEELVVESAKMAEYQKKNIGKDESQLDMLKKLELSDDDFKNLKKYCDSKKIVFLSTPHTEAAVDLLNPLVPLYKIGSADITNIPLLEAVARTKKIIILSTGMANMKEIHQAMNAIKVKGNKKIVLLHCTSNYPCPLNEVNLNAMLTLEREFGLPVGYSDHTSENMVSVMAATMGAEIIEKHLTLDKDMPGPDHKASANPEEFKKMVRMIRDVDIILGNGIKKPTKSEEAIKKNVRKSIVAKTDILKGAVIKAEMLAIKRPGSGIEPKYLQKIIGRKAKKNIGANEMISWKNI